MTILTNPQTFAALKARQVENVSRRSILKVLGLAGGFGAAAP